MRELNISLGGWSSKHLLFEGMRILIQHFICVFNYLLIRVWSVMGVQLSH